MYHISTVLVESSDINTFDKQNRDKQSKIVCHFDRGTRGSEGSETAYKSKARYPLLSVGLELQEAC